MLDILDIFELKFQSYYSLISNLMHAYSIFYPAVFQSYYSLISNSPY